MGSIGSIQRMAAVRWPWQTRDSAAVVSWVGAVPGVLKINNKGLEYYLYIGEKEGDKQKGESEKCVHALRNVCNRFACGALILKHDMGRLAQVHGIRCSF